MLAIFSVPGPAPILKDAVPHKCVDWKPTESNELGKASLGGPPYLNWIAFSWEAASWHVIDGLLLAVNQSCNCKSPLYHEIFCRQSSFLWCHYRVFPRLVDFHNFENLARGGQNLWVILISSRTKMQMVLLAATSAKRQNHRKSIFARLLSVAKMVKFRAYIKSPPFNST